ncbi:MAG: hypothetical protein SPJ62_07980 [Inconstantimicrobium porci]|uniref:Uncharacterized protein n=1 Tax=Inconstantimicrobium porci TaxID=2652291 RepID=A0A7X2T1T4_9CLOT|nr:hypothetical protein [Inconstantimicrobium porci]MDY5911926.1 hypothetical protein [Inconstantimicrobium porci]MSR92026.1 hypothetical protein [Inconstantimicrobium porci]
MDKLAEQSIIKILNDEYGIKNGNDLYKMDSEDVAEIYENLKGEQEEYDLSDEEMEEILDKILNIK